MTQRGYILLETVVSGAIVGVAMLGLLGQLGHARVAGIAFAREQTASRLAAVELEVARSRTATIEPGVLRREDVRVGKGTYSVTTVAEPEAVDLLPAPGGAVNLDPRFIRVRTEVVFHIDRADRRVVASTRLYR
jgi:type II secretory pathway pseudopilin PulG